MKNLINLITTAALLTATTAFATEGTYVGIEAQRNHVSSGRAVNDSKGQLLNLNSGNDLKLRKGNNAMGLFAGYRFNELFGLEAGYSFGFAKSQTVTVLRTAALGGNVERTLKQRHNNAYLDAIGYLPLHDSFELIGSLGVGYLKSKVTGLNDIARVTLLEKSSKLGLRAGLGAQYQVSDAVSIRLLGTYQQGNKLAKKVITPRLGLTYAF